MIGAVRSHMSEMIDMNNPKEIECWDQYVLAHPKGTPYHMSGWIRTLSTVYRFEPHLWVERNGKGDIAAVLPFLAVHNILAGSKLVSLPYSDFCGPLCNSQSELEGLISAVIKTEKKMNYIEIRDGVEQGQRCFEGFHETQSYVRHILHLNSDPNAVLEKVDKRTIRYSIRKAQRAEILIAERNDEDGMAGFYRLMRMTRKKHGVPCQPMAFFKSLFINLIRMRKAFILVAYDGEREVAAGLFLKFNRQLHYKYNASDNLYLIETKRTPNHLLTWHAIENACKSGCSLLDFGRTDEANRSLIEYKEMWGAEAIPIRYWEYSFKHGNRTRPQTSHSQWARLWRYMPDGISRFLEPFVYRHLS
jgi:CelD/BcsL family acetyltransferase involved in cellulose biosynthesis